MGSRELAKVVKPTRSDWAMVALVRICFSGELVNLPMKKHHFHVGSQIKHLV
jgi:hypothetical protein